MKKVVCFGEVLWDVFPDHRSIGGAPLNVALRSNSFGLKATIISSVGKDEDGSSIIKHLEDNNIKSDAVQVNELLNTGTVKVTLDKCGSASYNINYPVAWDNIQLTKESIELVKLSDAFVFGSLACRDNISYSSLLEYMENAKFKVFDVNLRPPHYSIGIILSLMVKSDMIKFNDDELKEICLHLNFHIEDLEKQIKFIAKKTNTKIICVTRGAQGAILFKENNFYKSKKFKIVVEDTVGAGDSFLAALIFKILFNEKPSNSLDFAAAIGALVASKKGANPKVTMHEIIDMLSKKN